MFREYEYRELKMLLADYLISKSEDEEEFIKAGYAVDFYNFVGEKIKEADNEH